VHAGFLMKKYLQGQAQFPICIGNKDTHLFASENSKALRRLDNGFQLKVTSTSETCITKKTVRNLRKGG
jgi:hypothetical protein